jgi:hypothetical protein
MADMDGNLVPQGINTYTESDLTRFRKLGKDSFKSYLKFGTEYLDFIKNITRFYSLDLPENINEYLIRIETAPYLWVADIPTILKTEEYFSKLNQGSGTNQYYQDLKKYYSKWITQKSERDKQYNTMTALNLLEKDPVKNHVMKKILHANLISFNARQTADEKAIQLLDDADRILEKTALEQSAKVELQYLIQLYSGFIYYKSGRYEEALQKFESAAFIKQSGISALFYNALTNIKLNNFSSASNMVAHILDFDKERFKFAINYRSLNLVDFFLRNAVTYNIFHENDFVLILNEIEQTLMLQLGFDVGLLRQLLQNIETLQKLKLNRFFDNSINSKLEFFEKVATQYQENTNLLDSLVIKQVIKEFEATLDQIISNAEQQYRTAIIDEIKYFDKQVEEYQQKITILQVQLAKGNDDVDERLQKTLKKVEEEIENAVSTLESKLENLDNNKKFNPNSAFKNSMLYNAIISMIVFMITGFASGFSGNSQQYQNFSLVLTAIFVSGFKWGGLSYLVGTLVSLVSAASTLYERTNEKQRLIKQISFVKKLGEKRKKEVHEAAKIQLESTEKGIKRQIEEIEKDIESLLTEKEQIQDEHEKKVAEKVESLRERLLPLYLG